MKYYVLYVDGKMKQGGKYSDIRQAKQSLNVFLAFGHKAELVEVEE